MLLLTGSVLLMFGFGAYQYWLKDRELQELRNRSLRIWESNRQVQRTLATGLYSRFAGEDLPVGSAADADASSVYIRSNPYEYAYFVSDILEGLYGGQSYVIPSDSAAGVDIEHERKEGLYLVQVRSSRKDTDVDAVAVLHSQVVKRQAHSGWIVSTGGFTDAAKQYAEETDIVRVDGIRLVQMWGDYLQSLDRTDESEEQGERNHGSTREV